MLTTQDLLNGLVSDSPFHNVQVELLGSRPAELTFLKDGASNNALFLELRVNSTPAGSLPRRLVLKAGNNTGGTAEREVAFFNMAGGIGGIPGVVNCYGQKFLATHDTGLMLLELVEADDVIVYDGPKEEHLRHYGEAIRILASLHAVWWEDTRIRTGELSPQWTRELFDTVTPLAEAGFQKLLKANPKAVRRDDQTLIRRVLSRAGSQLQARTRSAPLCVTHGDAGIYNFVMDRNDPAQTTLVDFQMWHVTPPAFDLAYMMHELWPTEFRSKHGDELVEIYFTALTAEGVTYAREDFESDLRLSIVGLIVRVLAFYQNGIRSESEARERIGRLLLSFDELDGAALLSEKKLDRRTSLVNNSSKACRYIT